MKVLIKNCFFIFLAVAVSNAFAQEKLIFALELIRHGDRTPLEEIPNSPHDWKRGFGELTQRGWYQELESGRAARKKYVKQYHLLPANYNPRLVYVRSTDTKRTIASANAFLLGLYPSKMRRGSIPVHAISKSQDNLLIVTPGKNIFSLIKLYFISRKAWQEQTSYRQEKLRRWRSITGLSLKNYQQIVPLADNLYIRRIHHVPMPKGISNDDANEIIQLGKWAVVNYFKLRQVSYPMGHSFLNETNNYFVNAVEKRSSLKYVLLSAHDSSIMSVMATLGAPLESIPPYASHVDFALFKNNKNYYIRVSYNDKLVTIPACGGTVCSLSQFYVLAQATKQQIA
ncbi:TPA: histidine phosphatase family protein [Legionella feeleii]|uniref:Acid phosphatase n=1 Tax=Legionella feeleii TaxID=453 RepID=A0A378ITR0_9GAMM|nr:histidine phosphatase family protein [Legionella feeleii]STX38330.1 acid phosphatase [Legionella feeleii]